MSRNRPTPPEPPRTDAETILHLRHLLRRKDWQIYGYEDSVFRLTQAYCRTKTELNALHAYLTGHMVYSMGHWCARLFGLPRSRLRPPRCI